MAGDDQPLLLEAPVDRPGGVDVDPRPGRQLAHAWQPVAGAEPAAEDQGPQPPGEMDADRNLVVAPDVGGFSVRGTGRKCAIALAH